MALFGERCLLHIPQSRHAPAHTKSAMVEFVSDYVVSSDGYQTELQYVALILRSSLPQFVKGIRIERGELNYVIEGLNERSTTGKESTHDEWAFRIREL